MIDPLDNPKVNAFEIIPLPGTNYYVHTYERPGESQSDYIKRHEKNLKFAKRLKEKKHDLMAMPFEL